MSTSTTLKPKQRAFLAAYAVCGGISRAAKLAQTPRTNHYEWMLNNAEYAATFEDAKEQACELLEQEARRRAVDGVKKPVFYKGKKIASVVEYSDNLLMFLLKSLKPERYRDNAKIEHTGTAGGPLEIQVTFVRSPNADEPPPV